MRVPKATKRVLKFFTAQISNGVWAICLVLGFGFTSYGVLRENFAAFGDVARLDISRNDEAVYGSRLGAV